MPRKLSEILSDLSSALEDEHVVLCDNSPNNTCDINAAFNAGYPLWAACLLTGATECPKTERYYSEFRRTCRTFQRRLDAERDALLKCVPNWQCSKCNAVVWGKDEDYCGSCHADKPPENELRVADGIFRVWDTAQSNPEGRPVFGWSLILDNNQSWGAADLRGPVMGPEPSERDMLRTFMAFLSAALESRSYRERTGRPGENEDLFPADMLDWCAQHSDEISVASIDE